MKKNCFYLGIPLLGMIDFRVIVIVPVVVDSLEDGDWVYHTKSDIYIYISTYIYLYIYLYIYIYKILWHFPAIFWDICPAKIAKTFKWGLKMRPEKTAVLPGKMMKNQWISMDLGVLPNFQTQILGPLPTPRCPICILQRKHRWSRWARHGGPSWSHGPNGRHGPWRPFLSL